MTSEAELLPGLPPTGPPPASFPPDWGRRGREGVVVRFHRADRSTWTGHFAPGVDGPTDVLPHPDRRRTLVLARGDLWIIDPDDAAAERALVGVRAVWPVGVDLLLDLEGLAFARLGAEGLRWRTPRLSWDGLDDVRVGDGRLTAQALVQVVPGERWALIEIDVATGEVRSGGEPTWG